MPTQKTPQNVTFAGLLTKAGFYVTFSARNKYEVGALVSISSRVRASLFVTFYLLIPCSVKTFFLAQKFTVGGMQGAAEILRTQHRDREAT